MAIAPLLVEIGCEEMPAGVVPVSAEALSVRLAALLDAAGLEHGAVRWLGTPRRLVAHIDGVTLQQPDRSELLSGPPLRAARDAAGNWTKAAEGFAKGLGLDVSALEVVQTPKGEYVAANKTTIGRPTLEILAEALADLLRNLPFPKKMRWAREREPFIRPIHWIVALLGDAVVPLRFAGIDSGRQTRGHRFYANHSAAVTADLAAYACTLADLRVVVDPELRRSSIREGVKALAAEAGGSWIVDEATLETVTYLVEWPAPLLGSFDPAFLEIPAPVIRTTLRENQKLFTLTGPDGQLLPRFIAVANTLSEASRATIAAGNARVVSARLADARFFVQEDTRQPLEAYLPKLQGRIYLQGLGTIEHRVSRILTLAGALAAQICPQERERVERAALLCKCDLATRMVFEFPELQGFVGADYAQRRSEDAAVVRAIAEHYQPRFSGDAIPQGPIGACVALADKAEAIVGCFALGLVPTGAQDPYALRRQALGILRILDEGGYDIGLGDLIERALDGLPDGDSARRPRDELRAAVLAFVRGRLLAMFQNSYPTDLVEAVLEAGFDRVATVRPRLQALDDLRAGEGFAPLAAAFKRVANIVRKQGGEVPESVRVDAALFELAAERALYDAVQGAAQAAGQALQGGRYDSALQHLAVIKPQVDGFFEDVMVMVDDQAVRHNRIALLRSCAGLFAQVADFARIQA